jgi:hypothetical protein
MKYANAMLAVMSVQSMPRKHTKTESTGYGFLDRLVTSELEANIWAKSHGTEMLIRRHTCTRSLFTEYESVFGQVIEAQGFRFAERVTY